MDRTYDTAIVGGGITGTALLYVLTNYTNIKSIILIEKCGEPAMINSHNNNNSQTLHYGDIETNYPRERAMIVNEAAKMVERYVVKNGGGLYNKTHKMVIAVGREEAEVLKERYESIKDIFPKLKLVDRERIRELDPAIVEGRKDSVPLLALVNEDGYAVNFKKLAESFVRNSENKSGKIVDILLNKKVVSILYKAGAYILRTSGETVQAKTVVVAAGAHSLIFARMLGYGSEYSVFPTVGGFYTLPGALNSKVYTVQIKKLPFAAIHGDPDVENPSVTRFGPTTKIMPLLERNNLKTIPDFFKIFSFSPDTLKSILTVLWDKDILKFLARNLVYIIPIVGRRVFMKNVRKIIPKAKIKDLKIARGVGGLRPQIVNIRDRKLVMNEAKITGENIIFNMTPSPGASVCLKNAQIDADIIINMLGKGYSFNKKDFENDYASHE